MSLEKGHRHLLIQDEAVRVELYLLRHPGAWEGGPSSGSIRSLEGGERCCVYHWLAHAVKAQGELIDRHGIVVGLKKQQSKKGRDDEERHERTGVGV